MQWHPLHEPAYPMPDGLAVHTNVCRTGTRVGLDSVLWEMDQQGKADRRGINVRTVLRRQLCLVLTIY